MFRLAFDPIFGSYILVLVLIGLILGLVLLFPPYGQRLPKNGSRWLLGLRLAALLFVSLTLFRVTAIYTETQKLSATVMILLDTSESMTVPDELGGKTRYETALKALEDAIPSLQKIENRCEVKAFGFDEQLYPLEIEKGRIIPPEKPIGRETAIGYSMDQLQMSSSGKRILATVLLSDGTQRSRPPRDSLPQDAVLRFRDMNQPFYALRLGKPGLSNTKDIAVRDLIVNDTVFLNNELVVSGHVRISGYVNQYIPLKFLFEKTPGGTLEEIETKEIMVTEDGETVPFKFSYVPEKAGLCKLEVRVPQQPQELIGTNNSISTFVRVLDGGLKVLYIEGAPRFEQKFIMMALDSSPDINVDFLPFGTDSIVRKGAQNKTPAERIVEATGKRESFLDKYFKPGEYMVYILGDVDSDAFKREELDALRKRVEEQGAGIMFLGGLQSYAPGGYYDKPIEPLYPIQLRREERQPYGGAVREDVHIPGPIRVLPTEIGKSHYLLKFSNNSVRNLEIWNAFPELSGANRLEGEKGGAIRLLETSNRQPILISQNRGNGRVLASALDSTWQWRLGGFVNEHTRFWRQTVLWLAKMDDALSGDCWITLDKKRFQASEAVKFKINLQGPDGEFVKNASASATILYPNGREEPIPLFDEDGVPGGSFRMTDEVGDYTINASAFNPLDTGSGERSGSQPETKYASARFTVLDRNIELENPIAETKLLESLTNVTGGRTVPPEQLGSLLEEISQKSMDLVERRETKRTLYDSWPFLLSFIAILSVEWFLRKKWGLV